MIITDLNTAISRQGVFEVEYQKPDGSHVTRHLSDISFSEKYGDRCIDAYCHESGSYLTFRNDRIIGIRQIWVNIYGKDGVAHQDGVYIFACRGDNHLVFEIYELKEGDRLWNFFSDGYVHRDGFFEVEPISFHYVEAFRPDSPSWMIANGLTEEDRNSLAEFTVYAAKKGKEVSYSMQNYFSVFSNPALHPEILDGTSRTMPDVMMARHVFCAFTETEHGAWWKVYNQMTDGSEEV